ncbi:hypothetical protein ACFSCX_17650 [Bacillus salitolerans]|uniref:Uncharacterized protein n=1 Tax=Bacillus salitolerans TaxID=1437434 RepID=A0ABW4LU12_9BACI
MQKVYFALPKSTTIYMGTIMKKEEGFCIINVEGLSGIIRLRDTEIFFTKEEAFRVSLLNQVDIELARLRMWSNSEVIEYLLSFHPRENIYEKKIYEEIVKKYNIKMK